MIDILICIGAVLLGLGAILAIAFKIVRRGALTFEIDGFYTHVMDGDPGPVIRDVQRDATAALECKLDDPRSCSIKEAVECHVEAEAPECNVLLLSGGGQWGAFGAGLFERLSEQSGPRN